MQESKVVRPVHTLLLPYASGVCGLLRPVILELEFEVEELDSEFTLKVLTLTGAEENGRMYNMQYLVEDGDGEGVDKDIMTCILGNQNQWGKKEPWW